MVMRLDRTGNRRSYWRVRCDCGNELVVLSSNLRGGNTRSCGCLEAEKKAARSLVHGHARVGRKTPEYRTWCEMLGRCNNPNHWGYPDYGGRGIKVCLRWSESFSNFLADMGPKPSPKHSIDRYPNREGNYEPNNCRWATAKEQVRNRRCARSVEFGGTTMSLEEASAASGLSVSLLSKRYHLGWTGERLFAPCGRPGPRPAMAR